MKTQQKSTPDQQNQQTAAGAELDCESFEGVEEKSQVTSGTLVREVTN